MSTTTAVRAGEDNGIDRTAGEEPNLERSWTMSIRMALRAGTGSFIDPQG